MSRKYKRSFKAYPGWNYQRAIEDMNAASERGWQLVKAGWLGSKFVKNPDIRYRYQMDFRKVEDLGRYIETFREQGWEYVTTFNGWNIFRKLYDPMLPEEAYEIYTDPESLHEMNKRWARVALTIGAILGIAAAIWGVFLVLWPNLPRLAQFLLFAFECAVLVRGWLIMRNPDSGHNRRGNSAFFAVFIAAILLGSAAISALIILRPGFSTQQQADSVDHPIVDNRWVDFKVHYTDNYYLDLSFDAPAPMTFEIIDENGASVYRVTDKSFQEENIRLRLSKGNYSFSMSCDTGFELNCQID